MQQFEGSSPDSSEGNARIEPRKLRLFKTRTETKKLNGHDSSKALYRNHGEYKSLDFHDPSFERRYRSPNKDKEQHFKYPDNRDMVQSTASLKREERLLQSSRQEYKKTRPDRVSGCRAKTSKTNEQSEAWKTPLLNRNFRYSERFRRDDSELPTLRREKTFDDSLIADRDSESPRATHENRMKAIGNQLKTNKFSPLAESSKPLRKSLPSLLQKNNEEKDEFQTELKKATSRIRSELGNKNNVSENITSQNDKMNVQKPNPTKMQSKVKESSLKNKGPIVNSRRPVTRSSDVKPKTTAPVKPNKTPVNKYKQSNKENGIPMPDRGQASGKESTPEHSPIRKKESLIIAVSQDT